MLSKESNMRKDMIEVMDSVTFRQDGSFLRGMIKELRKDGMTIKVYEKDFRSDYHGEFEGYMMDINESQFDDLQLEIWADGRGCDNSAIGVSGCYEPWHCVWMLSQMIDLQAVDFKS